MRVGCQETTSYRADTGRDMPSGQTLSVTESAPAPSRRSITRVAHGVERGSLGAGGARGRGSAPPDPAPTVIKRAPRVRSGEALVEAVSEFVRANSECRHKQIAAAIGAGEHALHVALRAARLRGSVRLEGERIKTRYFPVAQAATVPVSPPVAMNAPALRRSVWPEAAPVEPDAAVKDAVESLCREVAEAIGNGSHDIRLGALFQAAVAEARLLQSNVPEGHFAARRLDSAIRRILAIRAERNLPSVVGLKRGASADWARLSREARRRVTADGRAGVPAARELDAAPPRARPSSLGNTQATFNTSWL